MDKSIHRFGSRGVRSAILLILMVLAAAMASGCAGRVIQADRPVQYQAPDGTPVTGDATLETEALKLTVDHKNGSILLEDKRNGHVWRSVADEKELGNTEIPGDYKNHVRSPFIIEYLDTRTKATTFSRVSFGGTNAQVKLYKTGSGAIEAAYSLRDGKLRFSFVLKLERDRMMVDIPGNRIEYDKGDAILKSIHPYPYFGAVLGKSKEGYLFIPNGPGFAMNFYDRNYPYPGAYQEVVYGWDYGLGLEGQGRPASVQAPVFGVKQNNNAFLAVLDQGEATAKISAAPSGLNTPYNGVWAEYHYLPDDYIKKPYSSQAKQYVEDYMKRTDRRTVYSFLTGAEADYVGMGKAYRGYLMNDRGAKKLQPSPGESGDPLSLTLYMANSEMGMFGRKAVAVTTFKQAQDMLRELHANGVKQVNLNLQGWNKGGEFPGELPARLPPDPSLGSERDLLDLIEYGRSIGVKVALFDNYFESTSKNGFNPRQDALRSIRGEVIADKGETLSANSFTYYMVHPRQALQSLSDNLPKYREWGIGGLTLYGKYSDTVSSNFHKGSVSTRQESIGTQNEMLKRVREQLGVSQMFGTPAFAIGSADYMHGLQISPSYDVFDGETVPFYPIAIHGLVSYTSKGYNQMSNVAEEKLKQLEYGVLPGFTLTHDETSKLEFTNARWWLLSSRFDTWKEKLAEQYKEYQSRLGSTRHLFIVGHRKLAPEVWATTYEDGRTVAVNYGTTEYRSGSLRVPPKDYVVVQSSVVAGIGKEGMKP